MNFLSQLDLLFYNSILLDLISIRNRIFNIVEVNKRETQRNNCSNNCNNNCNNNCSNNCSNNCNINDLVKLLENSLFTKEASKFSYIEFKLFYSAFKKALDKDFGDSDYAKNFLILILALKVRLDDLNFQLECKRLEINH